MSHRIAPSRTPSIARPIAILAALLALVSPAAADSTFIRGDCNADSGVDIGDAIWTLGALFSGGPAGPCDDACDSNDDGARDIGDAIYTLGALFSGGPPPPAPTGVCGEDPTPDALACAGPIAGCPDAPALPVLEPAEPPVAMPGTADRIWPQRGYWRASSSDLTSSAARTGRMSHAAIALPTGRLTGRPVGQPAAAGLGAHVQRLGPRGRSIPENSVDLLGAGDTRRQLGRPKYEDIKIVSRGEFTLDEVDLVLPGIGTDFVFARRYRSRDTGESGAMGNQWEHGYEIRAEINAQGILLRDGDHRVDLLTEQPDGSYATPGLRVRVTRYDPIVIDLSVDFGNGGTWSLEPVPGTTGEYRIALSTDAHGNHLAFAYDGAGRLSTIIDTIGRVITLGYDSAGRITSLSDGAGRVWTYAYYGSGESGGSPGDLKSVTTPAITGTPTGNDYPLGRTTTYTYTSGHTDDALNHNLISVIDANGNPRFVNVYDEDPASPWMDTLVSQQVDGHLHKFVLHAEVPSAANGGAVVRSIVNDGRGAVTERYYDAFHRCVMLREHTGFADPALPTTAVDNRPGPPLRPSDPPYFETRSEWNGDHCVTHVVHPNGNETQFTYEGDVDPTAPFLGRTNLVQRRRLPGTHIPAGPFTELVEAFQVQAGFGGYDGEKFCVGYTDARGGVTVATRDVYGNPTHVDHAVPGVVEDFEYDSLGRLTAHVQPNHAPPGAPPARRRDELTYHFTGPGAGQLASVAIDANGFELTTSYAYDAHGDLVGVTHPAGGVDSLVRNQLGEVVHHLTPEFDANGNRYLTACFYDANGNLVRLDREQRGADGALVTSNPRLTTFLEVDPLDRLVSVIEERGSFDVPASQLDGAGLPASEFVTTELEYDSSGRVVLERSGEATGGAQTDAVIAIQYDAVGRLYRRSRGAGGPSVSTDQFDYDPNGNVQSIHTGLEAGARIKIVAVDGFDNWGPEIDAMGNVRTFAYDANGNLVGSRLDGELVDLPGSTGNIRLEETEWTYDALDRMVMQHAHRFDPATQAVLGDGGNDRNWDFEGGSLLSVSDDSGDTTTFEYDSAQRLFRVTDAVGNQVEVNFDTSSTVQTELHRDQTGVPGVFVERVISYDYDGLLRMTSRTGPLGETRQWQHDGYGVGQMVDELGNVTRWQRDGIGHVLHIERELTVDGTGGTPVVATAIEEYEYDANGRLTATTDPNGNTTEYGYDALDRLVLITRADGTTESQSFDAHDQRVAATDANGSVHVFTWDALARLRELSIAAAAGVDPGATFATYEVDGRGLVLSASNDDTIVTRTFDSLGELVTDTTGGLTTLRSTDDEGSTTALSYPSGRIVSYANDALGRVTQVSEGGAVLASYAYLGPDLIQTRAASDGSTTAVQYDLSARPISIEATTFSGGSSNVVTSRVAIWDSRSQLASTSDLTPGALTLTTDWTRDSLGSLTASERMVSGVPPATVSYTLDLARNRTAVMGLACSGAYLLDPTTPEPADAQMNQYTQTPCDARTYSPAGELLSAVSPSPAIPPTSYAYDALGQLRSVQVAGQPPITYEYDALGRWICVTSGTGGLCHAYCGDALVAEHDPIGAEIASYAFGSDSERVSMRRIGTSGSPEDLTYHTDAEGSVVALTNAAGAVVERYRYGDHGEVTVLDAFGNVLAASAVGNPYLHRGRRLDGSGLYHVGGRAFYETATGRFAAGGETSTWADARIAPGRELQHLGAPLEADREYIFGVHAVSPDTTIESPPAMRRGQSVRSSESLVFNRSSSQGTTLAHIGGWENATRGSHLHRKLGVANGGVDRTGSGTDSIAASRGQYIRKVLAGTWVGSATSQEPVPAMKLKRGRDLKHFHARLSDLPRPSPSLPDAVIIGRPDLRSGTVIQRDRMGSERYAPDALDLDLPVAGEYRVSAIWVTGTR